MTNLSEIVNSCAESIGIRYNAAAMPERTSNSEISRRDLLKKTCSSLLLYWSAYTLSRVGSLTTSRALSEEKVAADFSTEGADYSLLLSRHGIAWTPDVIIVGAETLDSSELPANYDALVVEWTHPYLSKEGAMFAFEHYNTRKNTRNLVTENIKRDKDFVIADLPIRALVSYGFRDVIDTSTTFLGLDVLRKISWGDEMNRKDFVKSSLLIWRALSDFGEDAAHVAYGKTEQDGELKEVVSTTGSLLEIGNPQDISRTMRNVAVAAKMKGLEQHYENMLGKRPHFVMVGGIGHSGLQGHFNMGRDFSIEYLDRVYPKAAKDIFLEEKEALYTSSRLYYRDGVLMHENIVDEEMKQKLGY